MAPEPQLIKKIDNFGHYKFIFLTKRKEEDMAFPSQHVVGDQIFHFTQLQLQPAKVKVKEDEITFCFRREYYLCLAAYLQNKPYSIADDVGADVDFATFKCFKRIAEDDVELTGPHRPLFLKFLDERMNLLKTTSLFPMPVN